MSGCEHCGAEVDRDRYLCPGCTERFRGYLGDVAPLLRELDLTLARMSPRSELRGGGEGLPFDSRASQARGRLCAVLRRWSDAMALCQGMWPSPTMPEAQAAALATWDAFPSWERGRACLVEVADVVTMAWSVVDLPPETLFIGWCPGPGDMPCGTALYGLPGLADAVCRLCGSHWAVEESREALLRDASEVLAPAATLARALGIPSATIRGWRRTGKLSQALDDAGRPVVNAKGQPLYRLSDVNRLHKGL